MTHLKATIIAVATGALLAVTSSTAMAGTSNIVDRGDGCGCIPCSIKR